MPYNYDGEQQFDIRIQRFYGLNYFTKQFYGVGFNDHFALMDVDLAALPSRDERVSLYERKQADFEQRFAFHPERTSDYLFSTNVKNKLEDSRKTKRPAEEDKWSIEWKREVSVEIIRNLSNVSSQVRNEVRDPLLKFGYWYTGFYGVLNGSGRVCSLKWQIVPGFV